MKHAPTWQSTPTLAFDDEKNDWVRYQSAGDAARQLSAQYGTHFWPADVLRAAKKDGTVNDVNVRLA